MSNLLKPSVYWLFGFAPLAIALEYVHASAPLIFFSAALSIIPIARLIGNSTEHTAYIRLKNGMPAPQSGS